MGGSVLTLDKSTSGKLKKDDIALMARELVLVTLPHKDPGDVPEWVRHNGNITLAMQPGYKNDPKDRRRRVCIGYPYGSIARLILYWIVTEARLTGQQRLELGQSLAEFMRKLGLKSDGSTGKRSSANSVHRQLERLIYAHIRLSKTFEDGSRHGRLDFSLPVAKAVCLWWDENETDREGLWGSYLVLNDDFFKAILANPVPVRMMSLLALKKSPLGLDLYAWATFESYKAMAQKQGRFVAWKLLHEQFGTELGRVDHFRDKAKRELRKIMCNCPTIKLSFVHGGVQIHADSLPDVSPKETHEALEPPLNAMSVNADAPSEKAIAQVLEMKPAEGAIALTMKFREVVKQGKAENTDEAYISFAKQYLTSD
jgi:hypothetical protein